MWAQLFHCDCVKKGAGFVSDGQTQSALREWRGHMTHPATLTALAGIGIVLGVAGPFGTDTRLGLIPRLLYWLVTVALTYGLGGLCDAVMARALAGRAVGLRIAGSAVLSGICVALAVLAINLVTFGWIPGLAELPAYLGSTFVIAAIVTVVLGVIRSQTASAAPAAPPHPAGPALLARLPLDKRAALVALSVEDHYVRVQTLKGEALVLMRLSDAIGEVGPTQGAHVHRSHWAAFDQVTAARRVGDRAILTMSTGVEIPVSRANIARIKEAGLLL